MTTFIRLLDVPVDAKPAALKAAVTGVGPVFECAPEAFAAVPGSPFAYWVGPHIRDIFTQFGPFESEEGERTVKQGLVTGDDFRLVRVWWEPRTDTFDRRWFGFAKGGASSPYYADVSVVVGYSNADQLAIQASGRYGRGATYYYRPAITWPLRAHRFAPQLLPAGCIFSARGYCAFVPQDQLVGTVAIFASSCFDYLFNTTLSPLHRALN